MSQAVYDYVGRNEVMYITDLVMIANQKETIKTSINVADYFFVLTVEDDEYEDKDNNVEARMVYYKFKDCEVSDITYEKENYRKYLKCVDFLESLIKNNGGK